MVHDPNRPQAASIPINEPFRLKTCSDLVWGIIASHRGDLRMLMECAGVVILVLGVFWIPLAFMMAARWLDWLFGQMSFGAGVAVLLSPLMLLLVTSEILKKNKFVD